MPGMSSSSHEQQDSRMGKVLPQLTTGALLRAEHVVGQYVSMQPFLRPYNHACWWDSARQWCCRRRLMSIRNPGPVLLAEDNLARSAEAGIAWIMRRKITTRKSSFPRWPAGFDLGGFTDARDGRLPDGGGERLSGHPRVLLSPSTCVSLRMLSLCGRNDRHWQNWSKPAPAFSDAGLWEDTHDTKEILIRAWYYFSEILLYILMGRGLWIDLGKKNRKIV